jgi:hypothetical protein
MQTPPAKSCMYTRLLKYKIAAMGRGPWRSLRDFVLELGLYQPRVLEVLHDDLLQPNRYLWSSSTFAETVFYGWNGYFNMPRVSSYTTVCGYMKLVLRVNLYLSSTRVTSGQGIILIVLRLWVLTFWRRNYFFKF